MPTVATASVRVWPTLTAPFGAVMSDADGAPTDLVSADAVWSSPTNHLFVDPPHS